MIQKFIVTVESSDEIYANDLKNELDFAYKHGNAIFEVEEIIETTEPSSDKIKEVEKESNND